MCKGIDMDFKFIIDKEYLLLKMISNRNNMDELKQWKNNVIANILDQKVIREIEIRTETIEEYFISGEFKKFLVSNHLISKMNKIMEDNCFLNYYHDISKYLHLIQNAWLKYKPKINQWLKETIKLDFTKNEISVYISHPKLNTGKCVNQKYIFLGHWKGINDINYNIAYLCHENLHALLPNENYMPPAMKLYHDKKTEISNQEQWDLLNATIENYYKIFEFEFDIIHSIIELISDNELYTILSGASKYELGHNHSNYSLIKYKELILPYWFEYLGLSSMEIKERIPNFINKNDRLLKENDKINIENFIHFLINNSYIRSKLEIPELLINKNKLF